MRLETVTKSLAAAEGKCKDSESAEKMGAKKLLESEEAVSVRINHKHVHSFGYCTVLLLPGFPRYAVYIHQPLYILVILSLSSVLYSILNVIMINLL